MSLSLLRRRLLTGAALAALLGPGGRAAALSKIVLAPAEPETLLALFGRRAAAERIGRHCLLALPPEERSKDRLTLAILDGRPVPRDADRARAEIGARIRREFAQGATVSVGGWLLAATEVRLCALAALSGDPASLNGQSLSG